MITFLIAVYGNSYMDYLGALIESVIEAYSDNARIIVSYASIDSSLIESAKQKAPFVTFYPSKYRFSYEKNIKKTIPLKLRMWNELMQLSCSEHNVFLDTDMIILKPIDHFFDQEFDVAYTYKTEKSENLSWPLNTGVILVRKSSASLSFFKKWNRKNSDILTDDILLEQAYNVWGAADQAALGGLLEIRSQSELCRLITRDGIRFRGLPCKYLNETRCIPLTACTHVIHYKRRWREVLPEGTFTEFRPKEKCLEIFRIWRCFYEKWKKRK